MLKTEKTLTSLEVAEMVDRNHYDVLRDVRKIVDHLTESKNALSEFFLETSYEDKTGRVLPSFRLTKKGCELYATRMTGKKGTQFAVAYIERFNELEQKQISTMTPTKLALLQAQNVYDLEQKVETHDLKLASIERKVENEITLSYGEQRRLQKAVGQRVYKLFNISEERPSGFGGLYADIKDRFAVASYKDLRRQDLQLAINYINNWIPKRKVS